MSQSTMIIGRDRREIAKRDLGIKGTWFWHGAEIGLGRHGNRKDQTSYIAGRG